MFGQPITSWMDYFEISPEKHKVIGAVGGGGKTTLIFCLAKEMKEKGLRVAVTTTTHMQGEARFGITPIGKPCGGGKISGIGEDELRRLKEEFDVVLVEADGSHRLPFKVPADYEPVLPEEADLIFGIAGASVIGKRFSEGCHRYTLAQERFGWNAEDVIEEKHLLTGLTSNLGQKKNVCCEYRYLINQADLLDDEQLHVIKTLQEQYEDRGYLVSLEKKIAF